MQSARYSVASITAILRYATINESENIMPRKIKSTTKPATAKKRTVKAAPATVAAAPAPSGIKRGLARDVTTITAMRANFARVSDRDESYLAMLADNIANPKAAVSLGQLRERYYDPASEKSRNPYWAGSAKATDAGVFERLQKAGYIAFNSESGAVQFVNADAHQFARTRLTAAKAS